MESVDLEEESQLLQRHAAKLHRPFKAALTPFSSLSGREAAVNSIYPFFTPSPTSFHFLPLFPSKPPPS